MTHRTGGQVLVDQLIIHGTSAIFGVPGESYLAALDAMRDVADQMPFYSCRSEGGASATAIGYAKATNQPGVVFVTRGPGAMNASIGIHTALQDSVPLVMFVGLAKREHTGREAFQELDLRAVFGSMTKWTATIDDAARIPELVRRAFHVALSGRRGPVVIGLPEDMLTDRTESADLPRVVPTSSAPDVALLVQLQAALERSTRPLLIVGGTGWDAEATVRLQGFAESHEVPVITSFRAQDLIDNTSPAYAGELGFGVSPALERAIAEADLLVAIGARLGEVTTSGYRMPPAPDPGVGLVHIHPDPQELDSIYVSSLAICASPAPLVAAIHRWQPVGAERRAPWRRALHDAYRAHQDPRNAQSDTEYAPFSEVLREVLPQDAIITMGAGNYTIWARRFYQYTRFPSEIGPTSGAMGFGLPAAIGAAIAHPTRPVVAFAGDGCLLMTVEELATAARLHLHVIVIVFNNNAYGTIRTHQDRAYPLRRYATDLTNPDFAALAESFGIPGTTVTEPEGLSGALRMALARTGPSLIELAPTM